ncbi:AfsR/SARP family transcriptional regulator [Jiangella alkaliphila]|uniref:DNA-binding transcriptional activator of the SARP family n=1 Tax=Jiangella alkaliphila TaxID=419479 RepID=A0A1H2L2Q7_9ACTN|nr:BTAD domain-containing putative transcriptional regulator [Jiangella alkaliphila]SDU74796.1 DNA-binding transcriptional activator of the SARP family [Jiangella alkaliphila]
MSVAVLRRDVGRASGRLERSLRLLAEFQLVVDGRVVTLPHSVERVLAFLGISRAPISRAQLAGTLWPEVADHRANGDLRSALWRLRRIAGVVDAENHRLTLAADVGVDVAEMADLSSSLLDEPEPGELGRVPELVRASSLLPGWDEEWLVVERERYRMTRLRALERSATELLAAADYTSALIAASAAAESEPFRETAHRLVIQIHLAEGNHAQAVKVFRAYRELVGDELGIEPSPLMCDLVAPLTGMTAIR